MVALEVGKEGLVCCQPLLKVLCVGGKLLCVLDIALHELREVAVKLKHVGKVVGTREAPSSNSLGRDGVVVELLAKHLAENSGVVCKWCALSDGIDVLSDRVGVVESLE